MQLTASNLPFNLQSPIPVYKQLADSITGLIVREVIVPGERLPATRELAGLLGLNRTTVSAAYSLLEESGLILAQVGRGSFVAPREKAETRLKPLNWEAILPPPYAQPVPAITKPIEINFASARPAREAFPMTQFRKLAKQVIDAPDAAGILQLGSPFGYAPLRRYLFDHACISRVAGPADDLIVTNGCQQALDLLARLLTPNGESVVLEDPVYYGLVRVFANAGASILPVPMGPNGVDVQVLEDLFARARPRAFVVTPSFQNPTGATIPLSSRRRIVELAQQYGVVLVENDIYSELRYRGSPLPSLKELDRTGNTILLRSYSKVSFPGLRVGWAIGPRPVITRLVEAKQTCDLHSDHLSQAVLLRFAETGELMRHLERTRTLGAERLDTILDACARYLPTGAAFTSPEGGMNLWIELPAPLRADELLNQVQERGVTFLPGKFFSPERPHTRGLRISFGGLQPEQIVKGIQILGEAAGRELAAWSAEISFEPAVALV